MTTICKWGNSLGLRLPAPVASAAGLRRGTHVQVRLLDNGSLLITPFNGTSVVVAQTCSAVASPPTNVW
jgi:antitoxin component of MazEF toxin-antitoxin module